MPLYGVPRRPAPRPARSRTLTPAFTYRSFPYVNVYTGVVTDGATDGTKVTGADRIKSGELEGGTNTEGSAIMCAVRCERGLMSPSLTISLVGSNAGKWALAPDDSGSPGTFGAYGDPLTLENVLDVNVIFWAKAQVTEDEVWRAIDLATTLGIPQTVVAQ